MILTRASKASGHSQTHCRNEAFEGMGGFGTRSDPRVRFRSAHRAYNRLK